MVPLCQFDAVVDLAHPAKQVLNQVGGGQHPFEILGQPQAHHGQRFLQPLAQRGGCAGRLMFKPARETVARKECNLDRLQDRSDKSAVLVKRGTNLGIGKNDRLDFSEHRIACGPNFGCFLL
jgi:hypothetical protein